MDNKLSELKDVVDYWRKVKSGELPAPSQNEISITVCTLDGAVSRIAALLAELEAKDREIDAANARVDAMCAKAMNLTERAESAEKQLATPVRLPEGLAQKIKVVGYYEALNEMMDCVRAAGFKCVGDEQ